MRSIRAILITLILLLSAVYSQTFPSNVNASVHGSGTNHITWDVPATNVNWYTVYAWTNVITEANRGGTFILDTNLSGASVDFYHILDAYPETMDTNMTDWYYAVIATVGSPSTGTAAKLVLDPSMVTNESGLDDAGKLVDEQGAVGDPPSVNATNEWFVGYNSGDYPANAYIDLGMTHQLDNLWIFDGNNAGTVDFFYGSPGSWMSFFSEDGNTYNVWHNNSIDIQTRYIRISQQDPGGAQSLKEIVLYGYALGPGLHTFPVVSAINSSAAPVNNSALPPALGYFLISHPGSILTNTWDSVAITAYTAKSNLFTGYTGTVYLDTDGTDAGIDWQLGTGSGTLSPAGAGRASYSFTAADNGSVIVEIRNQTAETVNIAATNSEGSDNDTEGTLEFTDVLVEMLKVVVHFSSAPSVYTVEKAPLRYNKDIAYSLTLDDGYKDSYITAFPLLNGGTISGTFINTFGSDAGGDGTVSPGLFFTDGCGNNIAFTAGVAMNSVNGSYQDIHTGSVTAYNSWAEMLEMYQAGWDVLNHSYSHAAGGGTDYDGEVTNNVNYILNEIGAYANHFIIPSGDMSYITPAQNNNMKAVYSGGLSGNPLRVDNYPTLDDLTLGRDFLQSPGTSTANVMNKLNSAAASATGGSRYWYNDFTHSVGNDNMWSIGLVFPTFKYYMQQIESTYGASGSDNIWVAGLQTVWEYLKVRETIVLNDSLVGSDLTITFDESAIPSDMRTYALSLNITSDTAISSIDVTGASNYSVNTTSKLVNLEWGSNYIYIPTPNSPPVVNILTPSDGSTVTGNVPITASVTDNSSVAGVEYRIDSGSWISMNLNGGVYSNSWNAGALPEGSYTISVRAIDDEAAETTETISVNTPDTMAPGLSSVSPVDDAGGVILNPVFTLTFDEDIYAGTGNISISDGGVPFNIAVSDASILGDTVTFSNTSLLSASTAYYIQIAPTCFTDAAGNNFPGIADTITWNFTTGTSADTNAPTVPILYSPASFAFTGTSVDFYWSTSIDDYTSVSYEIIINGITNAASSTNYSASSLNTGTNTFLVRAIDQSGNISQSPPRLFFVDGSAPSAPNLLSPYNDYTSNDGNALFQWTATDDIGIDYYNVDVNGSVSQISSDNFTTNFPDGIYAVRIQAVDLAGQSSSWSVTRNIVIDSTVGIPVIVTPAAGAALDEDDPVVISWQALVDTTGIPYYELEIDGTVIPVAALSYSADLDAGSHEIRIRAVDNAGNVGAWSALISFELGGELDGDFDFDPILKVGDTLTIRYKASYDAEDVDFVVFSTAGYKVAEIPGQDGVAVWDGKVGGEARIGSYIIRIRQGGVQLAVPPKALAVYK